MLNRQDIVELGACGAHDPCQGFARGVGNQVDVEVGGEAFTHLATTYQPGPVCGQAVGDGADAVKKLTAGTKPNLVITDLNMPNMDGISLIKEIRKMGALKFTPILMLTTESTDEKKKEGQAAGATGWIVKPFNPEQMLKVIAKVLPS